MTRTMLLCFVFALSAIPQVRHEDVAKGASEDWLTYAGSYAGWRYSPLKQITTENVRNMVPKWVYHVPGARGLRSSPIVYQDVLYITNTNSIYAVACSPAAGAERLDRR